MLEGQFMSPVTMTLQFPHHEGLYLLQNNKKKNKIEEKNQKCIMLSHTQLFTTSNHSVKPWPDGHDIVAATCCTCLATLLGVVGYKLEPTIHMSQQGGQECKTCYVQQSCYHLAGAQGPQKTVILHPLQKRR